MKIYTELKIYTDELFVGQAKLTAIRRRSTVVTRSYFVIGFYAAMPETTGHFRVAFRLCVQTSLRTIHLKMSFVYKFLFMQIELVFIRKVLHEDSRSL